MVTELGGVSNHPNTIQGAEHAKDNTRTEQGDRS